MATYDNGGYCFSPLEGAWSYWGEAAISLDYARTNWSRHRPLLITLTIESNAIRM